MKCATKVSSNYNISKSFLDGKYASLLLIFLYIFGAIVQILFKKFIWKAYRVYNKILPGIIFVSTLYFMPQK